MKVLLSKLGIAVYQPLLIWKDQNAQELIKGLEVLQKASIHFFLNKIEL